MSVLGRLKRVKRAFLVGTVNHFLCGTHFFGLKRTLLNSAGITIGSNTKVVGPFIVGNSSEVTIGNDCWIGTSFSIHGDGNVTIGNCCDVGPEVSILTGSHEIGSSARRAGAGISFSLRVGNGCWIGAQATLMGNTDVGDGTVVAACALVNHPTAKNVVVGGVPAKTIRGLQ